MNWSLEQTLEQLRRWETLPKQRLYVVFTWGDLRLSSVCTVSEVAEAAVVLEFSGGGGIRIPLGSVGEFKFSEASEASFDVRALALERFPQALFLSFSFSDAKCSIAEVLNNVAMI